MPITATGQRRAWTGWRYARLPAFMNLLCLAATLSACSSSLSAINVEQLPAEPARAGAEYTIGLGDVLSVQVFDQDRMSGRPRVRPDGRITLTFVNDIEAVGKTPIQLANDIAAALKAVVIDPRVTVLIEESAPQNILVLGEVSKPGMQTLPRDAGVAQALAAAGGLSVFAHKKQIYVNRIGPPAQRIQFSYDDLIRMTGRGPSFKLRPGDVVVVQ